MSSNISISSGTQQVAANSGSSARQSGKSSHADGKFSDHLAHTKVEDKAGSGLNEDREPVIDGELPSEDTQLVESIAQGVEVPETGVVEVETQDIPLGEIEVVVKTDGVEQVEVKPVTNEVKPLVDEAETLDKVVVPAAIASGEVGKDVSTVKSQSEGAVIRPVAAANAKTVAGRRDNLKVDQGVVENKDLAAGEADDELDTTKPSRTMERPLERTVGRGRANGVIQSKVDGERGMNPEQAVNNNGAAKTERGNMGSSNSFGVRVAENRLASMMEASGTFDGDVKITTGKQENHMLPAMPQQLTITGMSRTVVSQVLELRRSGELETMGLDVKTDANKPVKIIEVQLMPRNLGTVGITIRNMAGRISISIEVQGAEAERLIKNEVDKIAGAIRQAGQVLEDISIKRGVQMTQQTDSLTDDRGEANFGQNSGNSMLQSSNGETDDGANRQGFGDIEIEERGEIAAASDKVARQGIYL